MKYLILIAFVFIGCKSSEPKKVCFSREQLMAVYYNGWLSGNLSWLKNKDLDTLVTWKLDSAEISNIYFK